MNPRREWHFFSEKAACMQGLGMHTFQPCTYNICFHKTENTFLMQQVYNKSDTETVWHGTLRKPCSFRALGSFLGSPKYPWLLQF